MNPTLSSQPGPTLEQTPPPTQTPMQPAPPLQTAHKKWYKRWQLWAVVAVVAAVAVAIYVSQLNVVNAKTWVVSPSGSTNGAGTDSSSATTLQAALDRAQPGDVIQLQSGVYKPTTALQTKRNGEASKPITLKGPESGLDMSQRNKAVIMGSGHIFNIDHSYYVFDGFSINGQPDLPFSEIPNTPQQIITYKDQNQSRVKDGRLIYVGNTARDVKGTVINNMFLTGAGGECIRMRNFTTNSKVTNNVIYRCGFLAKEKDYRYHNGEGIYIGTSTKSTDQPYYKNDASNGNLVQHNLIQTFSSECVNVKENAAQNIIDSNQCMYGLGDAAANESVLEIRGKDNQVTNNVIQHSNGYGIKLWSDAPEYGGNNIVAGNKLSDIKAQTITVKGQAQPKEVCGNVLTDGVPILFGLTDTNIGKTCSQKYPTNLPTGGSGSGTPAPTPTPTPTPQLLSVSPATGVVAGGTKVTLKVADVPSGTPTVTFGGTTGTNIARSDDTITVTTPARSQAGDVPVVVKVGDKSCSGVFSYTASGGSGGGGDGTPTPTPTPAPTGGIIFSDSFSNMNNITKVLGGSWKVSGDKDLQLADPKDNLSSGNSNIAIVNRDIPKSFTLSAQAKVKGSDNKFNDFSIIFDYADQNNYSFVSFNEGNDGNTSGIFQVVGGNVSQVADITSLIKSDTYYAVTITHASDGSVVAMLNGQNVAQSKMAQQPGTKVGFGTRNDSARFDDLVVKE